MRSPSPTPDAIVVGNGVAGHACAARLAANGLRPLLIGPGLPFDRPPLSKTALTRGGPSPYAEAAALAERGVELLDGWVTEVDPAARRCRVEANGETVEVVAPAIVLAPGLSYAPPPIPGIDSSFVNATPVGAATLAALLADGPKRVVIVGAGLIGVETAVTLAEAGHDVCVVDMEGRPLARLRDPLPALALAELEAQGVRFVGGARIVEVDGTSVVTEGHGALVGDVVVAATGGRPAQVAGVGPLAVEVDDSMRVAGFDGVYAIGDAAIPPHPRFGLLRLPHWDTALGTATRAAEAIAGIDGVYDRLPYWWSDIGSLRIAEVGYAPAAVEWADEDGLTVGRDASGAVCCVLVIGDRRRLRDARAMVLNAG